MTKNTIIVNGVPVYVDSSAIIALLSEKKETPLMGEYAMQWYRTFKRKKLRPKTRVTYENLLSKHIEPFFRDLHVGDIDVPVVQQFYDAKSHLSKSTVRQCKILLHQIFDAALEDKLIDVNPTNSVRLTYSNRVRTREALTQEDAKDIIRQLPRLKGNDLLLLALMIYSGMRRGEVLGLRWEDIDFDSDMINVERSVYFLANSPHVGPPKSRAGVRKIPLLPELKAILEKYRKEDGYIINRNGQPLTERTYLYEFKRLGEKIELHGATAHVFRHTFMTMAASTLDLKTLQTIAGHSSPVTTMGYVHKRDEKIRDARDKLSGMFNAS